MVSTELRFFDSPDATARAIASAAIERLTQRLAATEVARVGLTGGTLGIMALAAWRDNPAAQTIDYSRVHFWWGDERFVEAESTDRNELQARDALLNHLRVPAGNIHAFPARRPGYSLASAAADFEQYLAAHWHGLDFALMGMGPDGHVASLFPDLANPDHPDLIVTEANSPKPPSQRLSFSYAGLREFGEVWFVIAGSDKANVTREVLMDSSCDLPAAILSRSIDSVWFIDESAAAGLR